MYENPRTYRQFAEAERSVEAVPSRRRHWAELLTAVVKPGDFVKREQRRPRLLDIGCSTGDFLAIARDEGFDVHGVELSSAAAALAREYHGLSVQVGDITVAAPTVKFEAITLLGVLEHVVDPAALLGEAARLLAPGGVLLIYTPAWGTYDRLSSFIARVSTGRLSCLIDRRINSAHLQIFPRETLRRLLESDGLRVTDSRSVCEYNLPTAQYLRSMGLTSPRLERLAGGLIGMLINRNLFFRNNQRVLAMKSA